MTDAFQATRILLNQKNLKMRFLIIIFLAILWALKPIPYEDVAKNRAVSQEVRSLRAGAFAPLQSKSSGSKIPKVILQKYFPDWVERVNYQNQQFEFLQSGRKRIREANRLRMNENQNQSISQSQQIFCIRNGAFDPLQNEAKRKTGNSNSGGQTPKPRKDPSSDNSSSGNGITYKSSPGSGAGAGAGGSGNYDVNLPKDVDPDKSISDPCFWNTLENLGDSENESEPAEAPKPSPPTGKLTKKAIQENDQTTNPISPVAFID